jgi:hypothetical protein
MEQTDECASSFFMCVRAVWERERREGEERGRGERDRREGEERGRGEREERWSEGRENMILNEFEF